MFTLLARASYRRRRYVLIGWSAVLAGLLVLSAVAGGTFRTERGRVPGSDAQKAADILKQHGFSTDAGAQGQIVFEAQQGIDDPSVRSAMENLFAEAGRGLRNVTVVSPYSSEGSQQIARGRKIAYAAIHLSDRSNEDQASVGDQIRKYRDALQLDGLRAELGGEMFAAQPRPASEVIGLVAAVIILLIAFGSLLAMGLPIVTALFGIGCGAALVGLTTRLMAVPKDATLIAAMLGAGVGVDYALLIVTRFRQALKDGLGPEDAVVLAMDSAGRSVLFAGATVVIAVLGMFLLDVKAIHSLALTAAISVLTTMLASLTLLPALLGFAGRNIDRFGLPHRRSAEKRTSVSIWHRWSRVVQQHPWPSAILSVAFLLVLSVPVLSLRLGVGDASNRPTSDTTRRAYDLLSDGFGPGFNGPLVLAAETPDSARDSAALKRLAATLNTTPGVAFATRPQANADGTAALLTVFPTSSPQDQRTSDLVQRLRDVVIPDAVRGSSAVVRVGGTTAGSDDFSSYIGDHLLVFFGAVLSLSFLLLLVVFRSLLVPLKAVLMNMISIGASFGALVAVFQWGWGESLLGIGKKGPIEAFVPLLLFAIVFGLSMDYEVFLLSRIREEYDRTGDNGQAVADGLAATARVITAAAAVMVCVFIGFVLIDQREVKMFGFGLSVAVLIDATIVRLVLVPATMELLGRANWWLPGWLDRVLPVVHVDGGGRTDAASVQVARTTT